MSEVTDILRDAKSYASSLQIAAASAVQSTLNLLQPPEGGGDGDALSPLNFTPSPLKPITPKTVDFNEPPEPEGMNPEFGLISDIVAPPTPENRGYAPTFEMPQVPNDLTPFSSSPREFTIGFPIPDSPTYSKPTAPYIQLPTMPDTPEIELPPFDYQPPDESEIPQDDDDIKQIAIDARTDTFTDSTDDIKEKIVAFLTEYHDQVPEFRDVAIQTEKQLKRYLEEGGTGLTRTIENQILVRSRVKINAEERRVRDTTLNDMASRGFTLPSGAMLSTLTNLRQSGADNNAKAATEIAIAQAELEQKNIQFAVTIALSLRKVILDTTQTYYQNLIAINGQALTQAKLILDSAIEKYNFNMKRYDSLARVFDAWIRWYEAKSKEAFIKLELYKGKLASVEAEVNVDQALVSLYKTEVDASTAEIAAYKAQIEAVVARASLEDIKFKLAELELKTYETSVKAKDFEYKGFMAKIQGEEAKVKIYQAQTESFKAETVAFEASIRAQSELAKAQAENNNSKAMKAKASVEVYNARMQAASAQLSADVEEEKMKLTGEIETIKTTLGIDSLKLQYEIAKTNHEAEVKKLKNQHDSEMLKAQAVYMQTVAQVSSIASNTLGGMAQAAMSGMNVLAAQTETI